MPVAPVTERAPKRIARGRVAMVIAAVVIVGVSGYFGFSAYANGSSANYVAQGASAASATDQHAAAAAVIAKVSKLIELPQGETPTVATVSDPQKLQGQAFFAKAKVGDIVLIYTTAQEAFLYDPVENKLVEVAPITTNSQYGQ